MEAHETHETIHEVAHHDHHEEHAHKEGKASRNKKIAVLISVLAALLAIIEAGGKSAQNTSLSANIHANDLWAFYQAKHIRSTTLRTAADALELSAPPSDGVAKKAAEWRATASRYDSEPETGEGRKELAAKAKSEEARRDKALSAYHMFEYGAAALQIAIVLASASVVTGMLALSFVAGGLGALGIAFGLLGWLAPTLIHL
ncbi:DUF4337 domain-containing protein [Paramagnetospirillum magneticum]|uniref:DUF4337 domain-containing protein n=1 Tax=Paramagnetospirillum magneticum (strain ATCC 700264 / AMB-1) TaxID=342108 RepID=Q2VZJ8_PARM1|nr:DUF4337 domain-containing protein [Paramagnetospirillum magneticum]BAE52977.1 hypothetical protein amb4173 [Paramagnetospirillum magneticum AMB-1]